MRVIRRASMETSYRKATTTMYRRIGGHMTPRQYVHARERVLKWSHAQLAEAIGKDERMSYRYSNGRVEIPETVAKLVRRLVRDRLTLSAKRFDEMVANL